MRKQIVCFGVLAAMCFSLAPVRGQSKALTTAGPWHPEGGAAPLAVLTGQEAEPSDLVVGDDPLRGGAACENIGGYMQVFGNPNRYRGAVYRMATPAQLGSFAIELNFAVSTNLYFSIHRRPINTMPPQSFVKVWPAPAPAPQFLVTTGTGRAFYSSGAINDGMGDNDGFRLEADFEYAVGVAWGGTSIQYGYDGPSYPRPFSRGSVLGGAALSGVTPPLADMIMLNSPPGSGIFTGGAYSSKLCFLPDPGACCVNGGAECLDIPQNECNLMSGEWTAPQVTCADSGFCAFPEGACCTAGGQCTEFNSFFCEYTGGVFLTGEACQNNPCAPSGACCAGGICHEDMTQADCEATPAPEGPGVYRGDGTECSTESACNAGACCFGTECFEMSGAQCVDFDGVYQGHLTTCELNPCLVIGACCLGNQGTCQDLAEAACTAQNGRYGGNGTVCDDENFTPACGVGACCTPEAACVNVRQALCVGALAGTWSGEGTTCDTISPHCPGTCCWNGANNCNGAGNARLTPEDCEQLPNSVFMGYVVECPSGMDSHPSDLCGDTVPNGACCLRGGACAVVDNIDICQIDLSGLYQGNGTVCGACPSCVNAADCNDNDPCTLDQCNAGTCENPPIDVDDSSVCTIDSCSGGFVVHEPINCDDGIACTTDSCDAVMGCLHAPNDGACTDGIDCTDDTCQVGIGCTFTNNMAACSDGIACTTNDTCGGGQCAGTPDNGACEDGNPCTRHVCDPVMDCRPDGFESGPCEDGNLCTINTCVDGACTTTGPLPCDDMLPCTTDTCDPGSGCVFASTCDDADGCTDNVCGAAGVCTFPAMDCDDHDLCTADGCAAGACTNTPQACGGACCLGMACTVEANAAACEAMGYVCDVTALIGADCYGDADGNGFVNAGDRGFVAANIGLTAPDLICQFDMDGNGFINAGDRGFVAANIGLCAPLPNYQNGTGLNAAGDGPDARFPRGVYQDDGTPCETGTCP